MTLEIRDPELEALILRRQQDGGFATPEEAVADAFRHNPETGVSALEVRRLAVERLLELRKGVVLGKACRDVLARVGPSRP